MKAAESMLCLLSRTDYDKISDEKKATIMPFYDAFQKAPKSIRMISQGDQTKLEIMLQNIFVEESNKLLWHGLHDLVSPGEIAYLEIHNFDEDGNTIDIEKYVIDGIIMSIVKDDKMDVQTIQITGCISNEITIQD